MKQLDQSVVLMAIYPPLILLLAMTLWRMVSVWKWLKEKGWDRSLALISGIIVIVAALLLEQMWYGFGRFFPEMYVPLSTTAPVVGLFKSMYVVALLLWTRAYFILSDDHPAWRCAAIFSGFIFICTLALLTL